LWANSADPNDYTSHDLGSLVAILTHHAPTAGKGCERLHGPAASACFLCIDKRQKSFAVSETAKWLWLHAALLIAKSKTFAPNAVRTTAKAVGQPV
jgi:hypothetical protein